MKDTSCVSCLWTDEGWFSLATRQRMSKILPRSLKKHGHARCTAQWWSFWCGSNSSYLTTVQHGAVSWEDYGQSFFHTRCGSAVPSHSRWGNTVCACWCAHTFWRFSGFIGLVTSLCGEVHHDKGRQWMWYFQGLSFGVAMFVWPCSFRCWLVITPQQPKHIYWQIAIEPSMYIDTTWYDFMTVCCCNMV